MNNKQKLHFAERVTVDTSRKQVPMAIGGTTINMIRRRSKISINTQPRNPFSSKGRKILLIIQYSVETRQIIRNSVNCEMY
jgi:hypothetical protein